jgi:hypothetical protein
MFSRSLFPRAAFPADAFASAGLGAGGVVDTGQFLETGIADVAVSSDDTSLYISWTADATVPAGSVYQIYINGNLKWEDIATHATIPLGAAVGTTLAVHVGRVGPWNRGVDYAASLAIPPGSGDRVRLQWTGGRWLSPDLMGFRIYRSAVAGGAIDRTGPVATVPASMGGEWGDGFGRGAFGSAPFGRSPVPYEWTSGHLEPGAWSFSVCPFDSAGTEPANPPVATFTIAGPPAAPALANGRRLHISSYDQPSRSVTLAWTNTYATF